MTNFKTTQTTFHLPVGYKHLLFGIDKEHIIAKAETFFVVVFFFVFFFCFCFFFIQDIYYYNYKELLKKKIITKF